MVYFDLRFWSQDQEDRRPDKRKREKSPIPVDQKWMEKPTFLTKQEQMARGPKGKQPEPDPDPEPKPEPDPDPTTDPLVRNKVKEKVERLNLRTKNSPGKFPGGKQSLIQVYFTRKSPKAKQAREKISKQTETQNKELQGALKSPLSGDVGSPGPTDQPSLGPDPVPEVRGRVWETGEKKKTSKVLERWPLALRASPGGLEKRKPEKRLQKTQIGKDLKERKTQFEGRKQGLMEKWLQREVTGSESSSQSSEKKEKT